MPQSRQNIGRLLTLFATLLGIAASAYLISVHIEVATTEEASGLCNISETLNCASAASSSYSKIVGIPIAVWGFGFYVAAFLIGLSSFASRKRKDGAGDVLAGGSALLLIGYTLSVVYSIFLAVVSAVVLKTFCPGCIALYVANALGLVGSLWWYGAGPGAAVGAIVGNVGSALNSPRFVGFIGIFLISVFVPNAMVSRYISGFTDPEAQGEAVSAEILQDAANPSLGPADAAVVIVEFSDFQCPYCAALSETMHEVHEAYPDQVRIEFRNYPLEMHQDADRAALAAVCANEQGRFWELHDLMFGNQQQLGGDDLLELAEEAGLDVASLEGCMDSSFARDKVDADMAAGEAAGVTGTPGWFLNGVPYAGAYPFESIRELIDRELDE